MARGDLHGSGGSVDIGMTITGRSGGGQESGRIRRVRDAVMQAMDLPPGDARAASIRADLGNATDLALEAASLLNDVAASLDDADWGDPLIGRNAGEWTLESLIGTGGHGRVYRGRSAGGVWVAVKVLTRAGQGVRELEALRRLDHPGVAALLGHGELGTPHGPRTWIATELLEAAEPIIDFAAGDFQAAMDGKRTASRPSRHTRMRRTTLAIALPLQRAGL